MCRDARSKSLFTAASASASPVLCMPAACGLMGIIILTVFVFSSFLSFLINLAWKSHCWDPGLWETERLHAGRFVMSGRLF
jgi:hypothetical protein